MPGEDGFRAASFFTQGLELAQSAQRLKMAQEEEQRRYLHDQQQLKVMEERYRQQHELDKMQLQAQQEANQLRVADMYQRHQDAKMQAAQANAARVIDMIRNLQSKQDAAKAKAQQLIIREGGGGGIYSITPKEGGGFDTQALVPPPAKAIVPKMDEGTQAQFDAIMAELKTKLNPVWLGAVSTNKAARIMKDNTPLMRKANKLAKASGKQIPFPEVPEEPEVETKEVGGFKVRAIP